MSEDFEGTKDDLDKELPKGSEGHSDYKPADTNDANKAPTERHVSELVLDYASYVNPGTCRTPHHGRTETRAAAYPALHAAHGRRAL